MARVFTMEFEFIRHKFKAIVAVRNEKEQTGFHIRVFDQELIDILGQNSIEFTGLTGITQKTNLSHPLASTLLETMNKAILNHLLK